MRYLILAMTLVLSGCAAMIHPELYGTEFQKKSFAYGKPCEFWASFEMRVDKVTTLVAREGNVCLVVDDPNAPMGASYWTETNRKKPKHAFKFTLPDVPDALYELDRPFLISLLTDMGYFSKYSPLK